MVIKGGARGGAADLAKHLQRTDTNEKMELRELRGVCSDNLTEALLEMEAVASGARSNRHFYHASINTRADELLTPEQERRAIDRLEEELGLADQARAVVAHVKEGRAHLHIVWSRIDLEAMRAIPDSHNYRRHELVARELEREFGHERVQGAHIEREGIERPERTPSHAEMQQAERTGITPKNATVFITGLWQQTDSGQALAAALADHGWILARGDRRDFVLIDPQGEDHSLARRIKGARAQDVRERLADLDPVTLPSVSEARAMQDARAKQDRQSTTGGMPLAVTAETPEATAERVRDEAKVTPAIDARAVIDRQQQSDQARHEAPAQPEPAEPIANAVDGITKATDGLMNAIGGLVDFFVDGPKPPPTPAELEQRAAAAAAARERSAKDNEEAEHRRQAINNGAQGTPEQEEMLRRLLQQIQDEPAHERTRDRGRERTR